jgi:diguanylate cyclase (GGDEF)-like protein
MAMSGHQAALNETYDWPYVALSICIATVAAYLALMLSERLGESRGRGRYLWLGAGAMVMGLGIWAMHFTGMLAFSLPITVMYDLPMVGLSLLAAIGASAVALFVVSRPNMSRTSWLAGGVLMGTGVAGMHYIGMAAMRMSARPSWNVVLIGLSLIIAVAASLVALSFAFRLRSIAKPQAAWLRVGASGVMGIAIAGMHYCGMAAATFVPTSSQATSGFVVGRGAIVWCIIFTATLVVVAVVRIAAFLHRCFSDREDAFARQQQYLHSVVSNAPVILIALDADGNVLVAEGRDLARLGHAAQTMIGQAFARLYEHVPALTGQATIALTGQAHAADATVGGVVLETRWTPVFDQRGALTSVVMVATDITDRRKAEVALIHRSLHDPLTNLPNRLALNERLADCLLEAQRGKTTFSLAFIDLDRFKEVNDTLGHDVGDALLKSVAERIDRFLQGRGILDAAVRLGGDEFAVLLPEMDEARATELVVPFLRDFAAPHSIGDYMLDVHASIGIAVYPTHALDAQTLLRCADVAMYVAKRGGLGHAVYDPAQDRHSKARLVLEADMRFAIRHGGFVLHYQPQVDVVSGRITAVEALIRWDHPTLGRLMPDEFIPLAEDTGLIVPLTDWIVEEALRQAGLWAADGIRLRVAINISMRGLREGSLPQTVARLLRTYDVPAARLMIEVTESVIMADDEQTRSIFAQLAALGCALSIDDFGTGYSSLAYLHRLPVSELKIDKSFVLPLAAEDTKAAELVRLIMDLGHSLGLRVVAEGVETVGVFDYLASLGCDVVQGYFISRAVPAATLRELVYASWHTEPNPLILNPRELSLQLFS